jgi:hypothetical protein
MNLGWITETSIVMVGIKEDNVFMLSNQGDEMGG